VLAATVRERLNAGPAPALADDDPRHPTGGAEVSNPSALPHHA
jgi:hypothetical protein